jgi:DNA-binding beta-propeller fold protein YncE
MSLSNSADAIKISRVYGTDTLTVDRAAYANGGISAQEGISRELKHHSLDNLDVDGANWQDADASAVYGSGGLGTPGMQNSTFDPGPQSLVNMVVVSAGLDKVAGIPIGELGIESVVNSTIDGITPRDLAFSPSGDTLYVIHAVGPLMLLDVETGAVIDSINFLDANPETVAPTPDGDFLFVGVPGGVLAPDGRLLKYSTSTLAVVDSLVFPAEADSLGGSGDPFVSAMSPDGMFIDVGTDNTKLYRISTATVEITDSTSFLGVGAGLAASQDGSRLVVTRITDMAIMTTSPYVRVDSVPVGFLPTRIAINPAGTMAWVSNVGDGTVTVVDVDDASVIDTVVVCEFPDEMVVTHDGTMVYIACFDDAVYVLSTSTHEVMGIIPFGADVGSPAGIAIYPDN